MDSQSILDEVLNSNLTDATSQAKIIRKDNYRDLVAFGNVTSYSMQQVLRACNRKFQLMKMGADCNEPGEQVSNCDFAFGHAVGAGVAVLDESADIRAACWAAFLSWNIGLLEEPARKPNRPASNKTFFHALWALHVYQTFREEETDLSEYEVVKTEATIAVDFEDGHFYVGHIDELLQHKETGRLKVKENKTTVYATVDPAMYANSDQALSYAVVVDQLGGSEYDVLYTIYSSTEQRWLQFEFTKTSAAKAQWLQSQYFVHDDIDRSAEYNFFPKNGGSCLAFGRRCEHFESCDFNMDRVYGKKFGDLRKLQSLEELEEIEHIDYAFKISEITAGMKSALQGKTET